MNYEVDKIEDLESSMELWLMGNTENAVETFGGTSQLQLMKYWIMSDYDTFLDRELEKFYNELETEDLETEEWDGPYPEDGYDYDYE